VLCCTPLATELVAEPITQYLLFVAQIVVRRAYKPRLVGTVADLTLASTDDVATTVGKTKLKGNVWRVDLPGDTDVAELRTTPGLKITGQIDVGDFDLKLH